MNQSANSAAFELLDALFATSHIAPGAQGRIFRVVDDLQVAGAPVEHIRIAERISVSLIMLQNAVRDGQEARRDELIERLRELRDEWDSLPAPSLIAA